jgi:hypothetical protein
MLRFVYDESGLLAALERVQSTNHAGYLSLHLVDYSFCSHRNRAASGLHGWGLVHLELETPDTDELRTLLADLHPALRHVGLDDDIKGILTLHSVSLYCHVLTL